MKFPVENGTIVLVTKENLRNANLIYIQSSSYFVLCKLLLQKQENWDWDFGIFSLGPRPQALLHYFFSRHRQALEMLFLYY